jgi:hypothetical protein
MERAGWRPGPAGRDGTPEQRGRAQLKVDFKHISHVPGAPLSMLFMSPDMAGLRPAVSFKYELAKDLYVFIAWFTMAFAAGALAFCI